MTSTFISFPGLPIYASKDLINWKLISHAWNREGQLPGASASTRGQQHGMFAATLRYREGLFYAICEYLGVGAHNIGVIFTSPDPFDETSWSDPVTFETDYIDPDLFWDDDGKVYVATQGIILQEIDLATGELSQPPVRLWNGTGGVWPEGPHLYKKDGYYYLMIAEGGTETNHSITIARSRNLKGPYEAYKDNPILSNRGTDEYLQTVGHGDLFQDAGGNWWGVALSTRSGPDWEIYPMGRETVLFPVTWDEGEWPVMQPVRGKMSGWALPPAARELPGIGPFNTDDDIYDFEKWSAIPRNLVYWRVPPQDAISITEKGLQMIPTRNNLTGTPDSAATPGLTGQAGLSFIGRRQTHTLFTFSVDVSFSPAVVGQEAGVTVFLTQLAHIDLGIVLLASPNTTSSSSGAVAPPPFLLTEGKSRLAFRFRAEGTGIPPTPKIMPVPSTWRYGEKIRLQIETLNSTHYGLAAMPADNPKAKLTIGTASAELVSGGSGSFVGSLVGAYATCNGAGSGLACPRGGNAYFSRWRYIGEAQFISATESIQV